MGERPGARGPAWVPFFLAIPTLGRKRPPHRRFSRALTVLAQWHGSCETRSRDAPTPSIGVSMQKTKLAIAAAVAATCVSSFAADPVKSDWTIAGNAGLFSD